MSDRVWKLLLLGGFLLGGFLIFQPYIPDSSTAEVNAPEAMVTIIVEKEKIASFRVAVYHESTVQQAIEAFEQQYQVDVDIKESSYGPYIHAVNGEAAEGQDRWVYYVNDFAPTIGINQYTVSGGDILLIKFESLGTVTEEQQ